MMEFSYPSSPRRRGSIRIGSRWIPAYAEMTELPSLKPRTGPFDSQERIDVTKVVRSLLALVGPMVMASAMGAVSQQQLAAAASKVDKNVIAWRRDIHEHPELSN